jgi:hypothetical protein
LKEKSNGLLRLILFAFQTLPALSKSRWCKRITVAVVLRGSPIKYVLRTENTGRQQNNKYKNILEQAPR